MIPNSNFNAQDDEISALIDVLYSELMMLRFEYMALRKKGKKDVDDLLEKIINMNEDFEALIKSHTLYLRFKKATGQTKTTHSVEMLKRINDIKVNIGSIVTDVPRS